MVAAKMDSRKITGYVDRVDAAVHIRVILITRYIHIYGSVPPVNHICARRASRRDGYDLTRCRGLPGGDKMF